MITVQSYESVNGLKFGASVADAERVFGKPPYRRLRTSDVVELFYDEMTLSFRGDKMCECTIPNGVELWIDGIKVSWTPEYFVGLIKSEITPLEFGGSVVLLKLGISLYGYEEGAESDRAVTAFRQNVWDPYRDKLKPFKLPEQKA